MTNIGSISALLRIAEKAIDAHGAEDRRRMAHEALRDAYTCWKRKNGVKHVERDSLDWTRMLGATAVAYTVVEAAKREERNAQRRLATAIRRYQEGGAA